MSSPRERIRDTIKRYASNVLGMPEEEAEKVADLLTKYHFRKIIIGIKTAQRELADRRGKIKRKISVEELEKYIRKVRF